MSDSLKAEDFINKHKTHGWPIIDVRSPSEFHKGHIPAAYNIPIFKDTERKEIGRIYKQVNKEEAVKKGLEFIGPRLRSMVEEAESLNANNMLAYCWRGGMRSNSFAWLLRTLDVNIITLHGGYKAFRNFVLNSFLSKKKIYILGGFTGSGKTEVLHEFKKMGEQIIDIEGLANHKGSVFGHLGEREQPTNQQFENELAMEWIKTKSDKPIWIEDESRIIGQVTVPNDFFMQMKTSPVFFLDLPRYLRIQRLVKEYTVFPQESLRESILRIQRKLGGVNAKLALESIDQKHCEKAVEITLKYYDKTYTYMLSQRNHDQIYKYSSNTTDAIQNAKRILSI